MTEKRPRAGFGWGREGLSDQAKGGIGMVEVGGADGVELCS